MEPLDPKLARLVHDGMVQAVPGPEVEDRVLLGLLARLPHGSPPGGDGEGIPHGGEGTTAGTTAATGTAAASKAWVLAAVLGVAAVTGGAVLGGRRDAQETAARDGTVTAQPEREAQAPRPAPSATETTPTAPEANSPVLAPPHASTSTAEPSSANERHSPRSRSPRPASVDAATDRSTPDSTVSDSTVSDSTSTSDDLAAEIQQIAAADRALARGELRRALQLAREHATAHPHGQLGLERTAIELGARCQLGEPGAAEAAATFLREHADAPAAAKVRTRCAAERPEQ